MFALLVALPFQLSAPINKQDSQVPPTEPTAKVQRTEKPRKAERPARTKRVKPEPQVKVSTPTPKPIQPVATPIPITGNKETWLRESGIPENLWSYVDQIVSRESGWNPCAYYPGQSDCSAQLNGVSVACGLVQTLPCGKAGADWTDPVQALKWQYQYVTSRYGGYPQAVEFWNANHWY